MYDNYSWSGLKSMNIPVTNIKYDLEGVNGYKNYDKSVTNGLTKEQQLAQLPKSVMIHHSSFYDPWGVIEEYEDREDFIESFSLVVQRRIEETYGWLCIGFKFHLRTEKYGEFDHTHKEKPIRESMDNHKFFSMIRLGGCKQTVDEIDE